MRVSGLFSSSSSSFGGDLKVPVPWTLTTDPWKPLVLISSRSCSICFRYSSLVFLNALMFSPFVYFVYTELTPSTTPSTLLSASVITLGATS